MLRWPAVGCSVPAHQSHAVCDPVRHGADDRADGGNLHQSRHYSLYLALRLKARHEGPDTPVYRLQEVHHAG